MARNKSLASARRHLIDRRRALLRRSEETLAEEQQLLETVEPDWEDLAAHVSAALLLDSLSDAELMQLRKIQAALRRMDQGIYGLCLVCKEPIARRRLEALPEAELCSGCCQPS